MNTIDLTQQLQEWSLTEIPKEVPLAVRHYFPGGCADQTVYVCSSAGRTYHLMDVEAITALDIESGEIVQLEIG